MHKYLFIVFRIFFLKILSRKFFSKSVLTLQSAVLDPRMKLSYYIDHEWEDEWIQDSKLALYTTFKKCYSPPPGQELQENMDDGFDPQDELSLHLYGKWHGKQHGKRTHAKLDFNESSIYE